ncbi:MAG: hypothetical protein KKC75_03105 [Nanoarchaeota archaeon]|nr:hypothetical protein [Nanoarchaeota archaeon]MBU1004605.1 hypothetical protein [Nanoarchaeota archaeon]MBU1945531.1 hypothetical protein [Nanoarchaeota archaeon]
MNLLNYSLAALLSYLGLFAGLLLAIIAKEELKAGKKYFIITKKVIIALIFISIIFLAQLKHVLILIALLIITTSLVKYSKTELVKTHYTYLLFSAIFYLSSKRLELFAVSSSLIFLYGLPAGTLLSYKTKKEAITNILKNVVFVVIAIAIYIIF